MANMQRTDFAGRLIQQGELLADDGRVLDGLNGRQGPDAQPFSIAMTNPVEIRDAFDVDETPWNDTSMLHLDEQIGSTGEHFGLFAVAMEQRTRLFDGISADGVEIGQRK